MTTDYENEIFDYSREDKFIYKKPKLFVSYYMYYRDGEGCSLGCKSHISHPCERCGRIGAKGEADVPVWYSR